MMSEAGKRMLERMPPYYVASRIMQALWDAQGSEIDGLNSTLNEVLNQFYVNTATWGLKYWEEALGIPVEENKPVDARRSNIVAKLRSSKTINVQVLKDIALSYEYGDIDVVEDVFSYLLYIIFVDVRGIPPYIQDFEKSLREVIPAHLNVEFVYKFLLWFQLDALSWRWDDLDALNLTWDELEVYGP